MKLSRLNIEMVDRSATVARLESTVASGEETVDKKGEEVGNAEEAR